MHVRSPSVRPQHLADPQMQKEGQREGTRACSQLQAAPQAPAVPHTGRNDVEYMAGQLLHPFFCGRLPDVVLSLLLPWHHTAHPSHFLAIHQRPSMTARAHNGQYSHMGHLQLTQPRLYESAGAAKAVHRAACHSLLT